MKNLSLLSLKMLLLMMLSACLSTNKKQVDPIMTEKEFKAPFESTWRAVQQAIISYPLKTNNMDVGQIQTSSIRGTNLFKVPFQESKAAGGHRYALTINVIKAGPKRTRVNVMKESSVYRDFVSDPEEKSTDGFEEMVLLYRIGREIEIERALSKDKKSD